jgi:predicted DNA-binding transcriptional regulator YafY
MSNMHRIAWIDRQIRERQYPSCVLIAEHFCLSPRQAARDIEYLRDSMCAPLEFCRKNRGYFYTEASFVLGQIVITEQQKQGLAYLVEQYEQMKGEHAIHLSRLFRRLIEDSPTDQIELELPLFPINPNELSCFDKLREAIASFRKVDVFYRDETNENRHLRLSPYKLYSYRNSNYIVGYCEPGGQIRFFGLHNISGVTVTDESFDLTPLLKQAYIIPELVPELEKAFVRFKVESYAETLPFYAKNIGEGLYQIEYYNEEKLLAALFLLPCRCSIESPQWLKGRFLHLLERKLQHQLENDNICPGAADKLEIPSIRRNRCVIEGVL